VAWPHDPKVTLVERGDLGGAQPFGNGDDRRVDEAEPEIGVALEEFRRPTPIGGREVLDREVSGRYGGDEGCLRSRSEAVPR